MRIRRKSRQREVTQEEIVRAIRGRLERNPEGNSTEMILKVYKKKGRVKAIEECRRLCRNSGSSSNGFWVDGRSDGIKLEIYDDTNYSETKPIAEKLIRYTDVFKYVLAKGEERKRTKRKPLKRRKFRRN